MCTFNTESLCASTVMLKLFENVKVMWWIYLFMLLVSIELFYVQPLTLLPPHYKRTKNSHFRNSKERYLSGPVCSVLHNCVTSVNKHNLWQSSRSQSISRAPSWNLLHLSTTSLHGLHSPGVVACETAKPTARGWLQQSRWVAKLCWVGPSSAKWNVFSREYCSWGFAPSSLVSTEQNRHHLASWNAPEQWGWWG